MIVFLEVDDDDDVIISAVAVSDDLQTIGDMRMAISPGNSYRGIPYEVFKSASPGEYPIEELQRRAIEQGVFVERYLDHRKGSAG